VTFTNFKVIILFSVIVATRKLCASVIYVVNCPHMNLYLSFASI